VLSPEFLKQPFPWELCSELIKSKQYTFEVRFPEMPREVVAKTRIRLPNNVENQQFIYLTATDISQRIKMK